MKRGAAGATLLGGASVPAAPADVVDLTGAGDAFAAGFLAAQQRGEDRLALAVATAARAVAVTGGRPGCSEHDAAPAPPSRWDSCSLMRARSQLADHAASTYARFVDKRWWTVGRQGLTPAARAARDSPQRGSAAARARRGS